MHAAGDTLQKGSNMKRFIPVLLLGLLSAACEPGNKVSAVDLTPTSPSNPASKSETFTGSVEVSGRGIHPFTITLNGAAVSVVLTAAGPPATIAMGLGVGTYVQADNSCTLLQSGFTVTPAGSQPQLAGTLPSGSYCVTVYDVGNQTATITYSVTVTHS
jgi:hypothetical protein